MVRKGLKSNKGVAGTDIVIAIIILIIFTTLAITVFYNIYVSSMASSRRSQATNYAVNILEFAERASYTELEDDITSYIQEMNVRNGYEIEWNITEARDEADLVRNLKVAVTYKVRGQARTIELETLITSDLIKWNPAKLEEGMTAIKWDGIGWVDVEDPENDLSWYNYDEKRWATVRKTDGTIWVWIPSFTYEYFYYNNAHDKKLAYEIGLNYSDPERSETYDSTKVERMNVDITFLKDGLGVWKERGDWEQAGEEGWLLNKSIYGNGENR